MNLRKMQDDVADQLTARPFVKSIFRGDLQRAEYVRYMCDVHCYALHSSQVIAIAGARLALSHPPMAAYLFNHAAEELGHDTWAHSDLLDLGLTPHDISTITPSPPCLRMIGLEYFYAAHDNPAGLFGWMFVLESLGGKVGGGVAAALDATLKLEGKGLYFLKGHGEADSHHSEDLYRVISENLSSEEDRRVFLRMYREAIDLYCEILDHAKLQDQIAA
jgi:heme oxygenase